MKFFYPFNQFSHDPVPLFRVGIKYAIHPIWHKFDCVLKTNLFRNAMEQINAETFKSCISCQILVFPHHYIWHFLYICGGKKMRNTINLIIIIINFLTWTHMREEDRKRKEKYHREMSVTWMKINLNRYFGVYAKCGTSRKRQQNFVF